MINTLQQSISKIRLGAARAALTLLVVLAFALVTTRPAQAQTFTVLFTFNGTDGATPLAGLVRDAKGNFYGTTWGPDPGTVFKVDANNGTETVLMAFDGNYEGGRPYATLVRDDAGALYGTAQLGGSAGNGVVFKLSNDHRVTILHNFIGGSSDGALPTGSLIRDQAGNFYGTTYQGGSANNGVVFKLTPRSNGRWKETVLHSFTGADGANPVYSSLLMDEKGNFYGVTSQGGAYGGGVVFKLTLGSNGRWQQTVLHSFAGGTTDGCFPFGTPVMDKEGNLYGTTEQCGGAYNGGIVWKLSPKGTETVLHTFVGGYSDGLNPFAGGVLDSAGNLYGTTVYGGNGSGCGTETSCGIVYKLNQKGTLTVLYRFTGSSDGEQPTGSLMLDAKGNLYGTAEGNSETYFGSVWKLTP